MADERQIFFARRDLLELLGVDLGMMRGFLFSLAGVFLAVGSLTVLRSPDWLSWKLALVAGEFGHWAALVALAVGGLAWATRGAHLKRAGSTLALSLIAADRAGKR